MPILRSIRVTCGLALCVPVLLSGCSTSDLRPDASPTTTDEVAAILIGEFSSEEQATVDPEYFPIALRHIPIWTDRSDGPWLYVEQALATRKEAPYRQRVYQLVAGDNGGVRSDVFELPGDPLRFAGASAEAFAEVRPDDLTPRSGCSIDLTRRSSAHYVGSTDGDACKSTLRGSTYATSEVDLKPAVLTTWDRGFDDSGQQVWGAVKGPYVFRRLTDTTDERIQQRPPTKKR